MSRIIPIGALFGRWTVLGEGKGYREKNFTKQQFLDFKQNYYVE